MVGEEGRPRVGLHAVQQLRPLHRAEAADAAAAAQLHLAHAGDEPHDGNRQKQRDDSPGTVFKAIYSINIATRIEQLLTSRPSPCYLLHCMRALECIADIHRCKHTEILA